MTRTCTIITLACLALLTAPGAAAQTGASAPQNGQQQSPPSQGQASNTEPKLEPVKQSITVTDTVSTDAPASISVLNNTRIAATAGVNIDDRLRMAPGFTLFRRSSSVVANPTTQGVSLRGIGSSGASRTLVLWDGIPENDPFGGWLYWDRFAPQQLDRIEISRGASTSVFGNLAMGGVIALFSEPARPHHIQASYEIGNENTHELTAGISNLWRHTAASAFVRAFTTDGYYIVPKPIRGPADTRANEEFVAGNTRFDVFGARDRFFVRLDILAEHRDNGTTLTHNSTGLGQIAANYSHEWSRDQISVLGYYTSEQFHASFSSVNATRTVERLSYNQTVPSNGEGGAAYWTHTESRWRVIGGADAQRVQGTSTDKLLPTVLRIGGGTQVEHGEFVQGDGKLGPAQLFAGIRYELGRADPSAGFVVGRGRIRARGSVYRSFRSPTLNELYREFRVGNTDTLANPALRPETLFGSELGIDFVGEATHASVTVFRNALSGLITNVTLSSGPGGIVRQRRNAADALSRGLEASVSRGWREFRGQVSYLYVDSQLLTGPWLAQVPRHQGSAEITYLHKRTLASIGLRAYSYQFDDDLNQFRLPGFATVELAVDQRLTDNLSARVAFDNLLDRTYYVAFTPTPNTGSPRLYRVGLRWSK
jgi:outer membrane cobalamin receptor